jgi:uncharacterized protein YndB with AHSA1/START domain
VALNDIRINARPADVFSVLTDPGAYGFWVVGSKRIRGHDRNWPKKGSRFHHTIGAGPFELDDNSKVLDIERDKRLVLEARFRPFGTATIELLLKPLRRGKATKVTMREVPRGGPARRIWNPLLDAAMYLRNEIALRRLKRLAEAQAPA